MSGLADSIAGVIVAGWALSALLALVLPPRAALTGYGAALALALIGGQAWGVWIAVMAPLGVMLPMLCLARSAGAAGLGGRPVPRADLAVFAALMLVVALGAASLVPFNPYGWFYGGAAPVLLVLLLALWALWRLQLAVMVAIVLGQGLWLADIGSSNLYDHLAHAALIPALALAALSPRRPKA